MLNLELVMKKIFINYVGVKIGGFRNIVIWLVIGLLMMALYNVFQTSNETRGVSEVSYTTLISEVSGGNVRDVEISGDEITTFNDG